MKWRLGIDLGSNSLGWAALGLREEGDDSVPNSIRASGVRIFSDGRDAKSGESNAVTRRVARGARRNRDRRLQRKSDLMSLLVEYGLMPKDLAARKALEGGKGVDLVETDPWILRARGLDEALSPHQLGRALFHLNQRRGFQSNRKADTDDDEKGAVKKAIKETEQQLADENARTLGELFGRPRWETVRDNRERPKGRRKAQPLARVRKAGAGKKLVYDYYPTRALIGNEFDQLWAAQARHHPDLLSDTAKEALREKIVWQRPLKSQQGKVGKCTLLPDEPRAPKALPSWQRMRIYQDVNHLRVCRVGDRERPLTREERDAIADSLLRPTRKDAKRAFTALHKKLKLKMKYDSFNMQSERRKNLVGDETAARLMQEDRWGEGWLGLSLVVQDEIVTQLLGDQQDEEVLGWLERAHGLERERAERVIACRLPAGYGKLSKAAIDRILPYLEEEGCTYDQAVEQAGMHHSELETDDVDRLPYYGEILERSVAFGSGEPDDPDEKHYGKVANPTVHVAMNQLRRVVNDLLERFGKPEQIVVELARDLRLSAKDKGELNKLLKANTEANEERAETLAEHGQENNYANRLRLRLYKELEPLGKRCVYSGEQISLAMLFSDQVEIDHILPRRDTDDDSFANKVLCMREANRFKGKRSPHEAFSSSPPGYSWDEIVARAVELPKSKNWRFKPDAVEEFNAQGGFLPRQLNDTRHAGKLAKAYLESLYGKQGRVCVIQGRLTSNLRRGWGLNSVLYDLAREMCEKHEQEKSSTDYRSREERERQEQEKNRSDHRHHAIDAVVMACTDRSVLQRAGREAKQTDKKHEHRLLAGTVPPWSGFREDVKRVIREIVVSPKPDHGYQGAILEETAYGLIRDEDESGKKNAPNVVVRKPLDSLKPKDLENIRDARLREIFIEQTQGLQGLSDKEFQAALREVGEELDPPVRKVRVLLKRNVLPIRHRDSAGKEHEKSYQGGSNYCCDIWRDSKTGKWTGEIISTYDAYQLADKDKKAGIPHDSPKAWWRQMVGRDGQPLLMRLRKKDLLELDFEGRRAIVTIYKMDAGNGVFYAEHFEANVAARSNATTRKGKMPEELWLKENSKSPAMLQKLKAKLVTVSESGVVRVHEPPSER